MIESAIEIYAISSLHPAQNESLLLAEWIIYQLIESLITYSFFLVKVKFINQYLFRFLFFIQI